MKKILTVFVAIIFLFPIATLAQNYTGALDDAATEVYGSPTADSGDLIYVIGSVISIVLSVLGVVLLVFILYAGFLWMTAGGDKEQVTKARTIMINTAVGLIITLAAYAISNFVIDQLVAANLAT